MPFKEVVFPEDLSLQAGLAHKNEAEGSIWKSLLQNQGPIIWLWSVIMLVNLLMVMFLA